MLPKRLKRVQMLDTGSLEAKRVTDGLFSIQSHYAVRDLDDYFEPTGLYTPSDWSEPSRPESAPADAPDSPEVAEAE